MITKEQVSGKIYSAVSRLSSENGKSGSILMISNGKDLNFFAITPSKQKKAIKLSDILDLGFDPMNMISSAVRSKLFENIERISKEKQISVSEFALNFFNSGDESMCEILHPTKKETRKVIDIIKI